jgi:DNA (cytosine-5)-methyltransferase 1
VCSGIEAASVAWKPLGWKAAWFSEIEAFPSAVLDHHWPEVANLGDMTALPERVESGEIEAPDVLVGGTPCQAFSVAGNRGSLSDARGNLTLTYVELANAIDRKRAERGEQPVIVVWENVPGVLNTKDNAFGCFLAGLAGEDVPLLAPGGKWTNAGLVVGPQRAIAWRIFDAQYFGVAQRRRRVFVVASARDGFDPSQILFEFDGLRRDSAPRRETRQDASADAGCRTPRAGSHWDDLTNPHPSLNQSFNTGGIGASNQEVFSQRGSGLTWPADVASTLNAAFGSKLGLEDQHINSGAPLFVPSAVSVTGDITHALNTANNGKGSSEDGTGRGVPTVAVCPTLRAGGNSTGGDRPPGTDVDTIESLIVQSVALRGRDGGATAELGGEVATALRASTNGGNKPHVLAFGLTTEQTPKFAEDMALTLTKQSPTGGGQPQACMTPMMAVRRLTPTECEILQGFSRNHTLVPYRGKPAADGPRYKACGNSMAVPVMAWIGRRIAAYIT